MDSSRELNRIFRTARNKHQAHRQCRKILEELSTDRTFIKKILFNYLSSPQVLNHQNYPVVGMEVELNPDFHLVANCWIPLPNREADVSTKAIHHHGQMLLTSGTLFGPGYEHWLFSRPQELDRERELYAMEVTERKLHPLHDIAFVDAYEPHLPLFPTKLTITLALWSSRNPTTWRDRLKRIPVLKRNEIFLKRMAKGIGLAKSLDLKWVEYFDFYPTENGFKGMRERVEFGLGPNEDFLQSLFHVIQETQNEGMAPFIEDHLDSGKAPLKNPQKIKQLLSNLKKGQPIQGRLSDCHLGVPHATFKSQEIERAVAALKRRPDPVALSRSS